MERNAELFGIRARIWGIVVLGTAVVYLAARFSHKPTSSISTPVPPDTVAPPIVASMPGRTGAKAINATSHSNSDAATIVHNLSDPDPGIRLQALVQLQALKPSPQDVLPLLIACLNDSDAHVRAETALCLGALRMAANDAVPALKQLAFSDTNELVRSRAKDALYNIRFYDFGPKDF